MKRSLFSLVFLLACLSTVQCFAITVAPQTGNMRAAAAVRSSVHRLPTIWERMRNPREAYNRLSQDPYRFNPDRFNSDRFNSGLRARASVASARASVSTITDPVFFLPPTYSPGAFFAFDVVTGDFNGDGKPDLAVSNRCVSRDDCTQGSVGVLLGNGDGTYQPVINSNSGAVFGSMTLGDFNRDGNLDVALDSECLDTGCTNGAVEVLLGNGDGSFRPPVAYPSGGNSFSVESGDLNGDGKLDLIAVTGSNTAAVLLGNGDGTFQAPSSVTTSSAGGNSAVYLGDFDGDNKLDLAVVSSSCDATPTCTRSVSVLLGNGDGTFRAPVGNQSVVGFNAQAVALADVNGDGKLDLAVVDACVPSTDTCTNESIEVFLGNGDGTFRPPESSPSLTNDVTSIAFADLNGDGKLDLGAVDSNAAQDTIMLGAGDGTFHASNIYETEGVSPLFGVFGDFNADGNIDLAVSNECSDLDCTIGSVVALLGNGKGTFHAPIGYPASANSVLQSLAVADFNGDGRPDLAQSALIFDSSSSLLSVTVFLGQTDGTFVPGVKSVVGPKGFDSFLPDPLVAGDFNQDGKTDLATVACSDQACNAFGLAVLLGKGDGTFQPPSLSTPIIAFTLTAGDFNGDGKLDLAGVTITCSDPFICNDSFVNILLGNGDGTFQDPVKYPFVGFHTGSMTVGDFNRDGNFDLVVANANCGQFDCPTGTLTVLLGNGDGTFQTAVNYPSGDFGAYSVAIGDFNKDGKADLAVSNLGACFFFPCGSSSLGLLLGNGDGTFQAASILSSGPVGPAASDVRSIAAADLDGDGNLDLALSTRTVLLGNGDGTFKDPQSYNLGTNDGIAQVVADLNGDSKPDLAVNTNQFLTVLLNISTSFQNATTTALASSRNPVEVHHQVTFTATVTSGTPGNLTGTVTFSDGGHALNTVSIAKGKARFSTNDLDAGLHSITASYSGDQTFQPSTSPELTQAVRADTRTKLTSSHNPSRRGQSVTFVAVVVARSGATPAGTVVFKDFSDTLATVELDGGQATFMTSRLRKGSHLIRAIYKGSTTDQPSFTILAQRVK